MALAVAMVACQGAVGQTGETGPKGEPGDPAPPAPTPNLAPITRAEKFEPMMLVEEGESKTRDVAANFIDPDAAEGETLTFSLSDWNSDYITAEVTADGMLTVGPVAAGETTITVTATDVDGASASAMLDVTVAEEGRMPPMYIGSLPSTVHLEPGKQHKITGAEIEADTTFREDEGEVLTYDHEVSDDAVVLVTQAADNSFTLTGLSVGDAVVTIIATDEDELPSDPSYVISVHVRMSFAPEAGDPISAQSLTVGGAAVTVDASLHFSDPTDDDLTYTATSSDKTVATVDVIGSAVTITPQGDGSAMVEVTATNPSGLSASQTFSVTVGATPPTKVGSIDDVTLQVGDEKSMRLTPYFAPGVAGDHLDYDASGSNDMVRVSVSGDRLFIEALAEGSAPITVTATDADGESEYQKFVVTVSAAPVVQPPAVNQKPQYKAGKTLSNMPPIQLIDGGSDATATDAGIADQDTDEERLFAASDNKVLMLDDYFHDPDGVDSRMTYNVTKTDNPEDDEQVDGDDEQVIDLHSVPGTDGDDFASSTGASGAAPDGEKESVRTLVIEPRNPGTAMITITVKDEDGVEDSFTFIVTVTKPDSNVPPQAVSGADIQDQTGDAPATAATITLNKRLTIGEIRKVIDPDKTESADPLSRFADYFVDSNFDNQEPTHNPNERLTISWKFYEAGTVAGTNGAVPTDGELKDDKVAVDVSVSPTVWRGGRNDRFSLTLTGLQGTTNADSTDDANNGHMVALIATDTFGKSAAVLFRVEVNNPPVPFGPAADTKEKDRKTLSGYKDYLDLVVSDGTPVTALPLTPTTGVAYFSDADAGDSLDCTSRFLTSERNKEVAQKLFDSVGITGATNSLVFSSNGRTGDGWIKVWCTDDFESTDKEDPRARLPVKYTRGASIH